jgi:membrane metallo-endopeptidase-like protein 1
MLGEAPNSDNLLIPDPPRRSYNRWLAVLVALFLSTTILFSILFAVQKNIVTTTATTGPTTTTSSSADEDLCLTPYCIKAADYLLDSIDTTVNPCEDIYAFACGTWLKNARIPEDTGVQNIFNLLDTQLDFNLIDLLSATPDNGTTDPKAVINARNLYNSCIDEAGIETDGVEPVLSIVHNEFGGWPILLGSTWDNSTFNLTRLLLQLRQYDNGIIFSVDTATNQQNSSVYDIELGQGDLGLEETEYYNKTDVTTAYRQFMTDLATLLTNDTSAIQTDVQDIFELERNISQVIDLSRYLIIFILYSIIGMIQNNVFEIMKQF